MKGRVARLRAELHVVEVLRAPGIAVGEQDLLLRRSDADRCERLVREQRGAGRRTESASKQQVAIAVHQEHAYAARGQRAQRAGHVPGAKSVPWAQTVNQDGTFKSVDDLRALYKTAGLIEGKPTIAYCRIGERSSHTWFVLKYLLGLPDVKNYDGSWTEYGSMVGVPIER